MPPHPIYALWCHPRSRSTALERAMMERGDLEVVHEPFSVSYYLERRPEVPHLSSRDEQPRTYEQARDTLLARAETGPVLLKEMPYQAGDRLLEDEELLQRLHHAFLIRDPALSIASHYAVDPDLQLEEVGLEALWRLYQRVREAAPSPPPVVDAERLASDPGPTFGALCEVLGLAPSPDALEWRAGTPEQWRTWGAWHSAAACSSGIHDKTSHYAATVENTPTLRRLWSHHLPFYEKLRERALDPSPGN